MIYLVDIDRFLSQNADLRAKICWLSVLAQDSSSCFIYITEKTESRRKETLDWLNNNHLPFGKNLPHAQDLLSLYMRDESDNSSAALVKKNIVEKILSIESL